MSSDEKLLEAAFNGDTIVVKAALEAGACINGHRSQYYPPILAATMMEDVGMVKFLLKHGAGPDNPLGIAMVPGMTGERPFHLATRNGNAAIARLLLEAGADPASAYKNGFIPLHGVAQTGHVHLVDMLYSGAPETLNRRASRGETPLFQACLFGRESMVSKLLSLGTKQPTNHSSLCPLSIAVRKGFGGVVRVLINEGGIRAVGGEVPLDQVLRRALQVRPATILRLLLAVSGGKGRSEWANVNYEGNRLLHYGAAYCYPAAVSILLGAGAREAARDLQGRIPRDVVGLALNREVQMDRGKEVAVRRILERGPAHRARSWAWPSEEEPDPDGNGDGDTAAAAAAATLSSPPAVKSPPPVMGVRIFRPEEDSSSKFFVRLIGRYCAKA